MFEFWRNSREDHSESYDDDELVYRIISGDEDAFRELYKKYNKMLIKFIRRYVGDDIDMIADVIQDTFVKILDNIKEYKPRGSFRNYVFTIAINTLRDYKRKEKKETIAKKEIKLYNFGSDTTKELIEDFNEAIQELPERERDVIILKMEGFSHENIGKVLNISSRTSKRILKSAINKLKTKLKKFGEEDFYET